MFLHLCVILFTGVGGWLSSMHHWSHDQGGLHPGGGLHLVGMGVCIQGVCIGGGRADPRILWETVNERVVRILLECIIIFQLFLVTKI